MKKVILITIILIFYTVNPANATIKYVKDQATGAYHNEVWNTYTEKPIKVYVDLISFVDKYYDEEDAKNNLDNEYKIYIEGGSGILSATGMINPSERQKMIDSLKKGLEWIQIAKKERVEITKEIHSFVRRRPDNIIGSEVQGIWLLFSSEVSKGKVSAGMFLRIEDEDNPLKSIMLYLEEGQIKKLITLIEKVPDTVEEIKKNISKSDLFQ